MISGDIQVALGYQHFFLWVLVSAVPVLLLSRFIALDGPAQPAAAAEPARPAEA
jgi:PAT family beta-lactamase induction signal transducer AmpG